MISRQLLRKHFTSPPTILRLLKQPNITKPRFSSTQSSSPDKTRARIDRILSKFPRFLQPYTNGLRNAPVSHITSFLILHELTAVIPLVGLASYFHYTNTLPKELTELKWVSEGVEKFGRYFGRKGWFGFSREDSSSSIPESANGDGRREVVVNNDGEGGIEGGQGEKKWYAGENGKRILMEVATAYAVTKVLLPVRVVLSVWGTPWFARNILGRIGDIFRRGKVNAVKGGSAAGTGATGGGVVGKDLKRS